MVEENNNLKEELENNIIYYLENHTILELNSLVESAIEKRVGLVYSENKPTTNINPFFTTNLKILEMESNCNVLSYLIGQKDLGHRQRMVLLFTYCKLGDIGVERLKQIMQFQTNYKKHITERAINDYVKKGMFYGISCKKIQEWCGSELCKGCLKLQAQ